MAKNKPQNGLLAVSQLIVACKIKYADDIQVMDLVKKAEEAMEAHGQAVADIKVLAQSLVEG